MFRFTCQTCSKKFMRSDHLAKHIKTHENKVKRNSGSKTTNKLVESNKKNVKEDDKLVITATDIVIKKEKEDLSNCTLNNNNNNRSICEKSPEKKNQDNFLSPNYQNYTSPYSTTSAYPNFQTNMNLCSGPTSNHSNHNNNTFLPPTPPLLSENDAKNMFHTYNTSHPSHLHHHAVTTPSPFPSNINNSNNNYNQAHSRVPLSPSSIYSSSSSNNSTVPLSSLSSNTNSHIHSPTSMTPQNSYHNFNDTNLTYSGHHHQLVNHQGKASALNYHQTLNNNSYYMTNITINQIGPLATSPNTTRPLSGTNSFGGALHLTR